jgi:hypothetical protein
MRTGCSSAGPSFSVINAPQVCQIETAGMIATHPCRDLLRPTPTQFVLVNHRDWDHPSRWLAARGLEQAAASR